MLPTTWAILKQNNNVQGKFMRLIQTTLYNGAVPWLWPHTGRLNVRPLMRLDEGQNIFQKKVFLIRIQLLCINKALTVTSPELFFKIENKFREVNAAVVASSVILKPFVRNISSASVVATPSCPKS